MDSHDDADGPGVWIVEERPALQEGKIFVDADERATISDNLEVAYAALIEAFRGIWVEQALEYGHVREHWDEGTIDELETLALQASDAADRAWYALSAVVDTHAARLQERDDETAGEADDT